MITWLPTAWKAVSGLIGGRSWIAYLAAGIALAVLVGWLCWSRISLLADLADARATIAAKQTRIGALETALASTKATLDNVLSAKAVTEKALAERERVITTITAQRDDAQRRWKEAQHDTTVRSWGDAPLPAAVRGLFGPAAGN